jgi:hypothetical protein
LDVVNVRLETLIIASPGSVDLRLIVTSAEGLVSSLTVKVALLPFSHVVKSSLIDALFPSQSIEVIRSTVTPEVSLSVFVIE